jgi:hypothetical protein
MVEKAIHKFIKNPGQMFWDTFIPFNMISWDSFCEQNNNLSDEEIKTVFDGEINIETTVRILEFIAGDPHFVYSNGNIINWKYKLRKKEYCFDIQGQRALLTKNCKNKIRWKKQH